MLPTDTSRSEIQAPERHRRSSQSPSRPGLVEIGEKGALRVVGTIRHAPRNEEHRKPGSRGAGPVRSKAVAGAWSPSATAPVGAGRGLTTAPMGCTRYPTPTRSPARSGLRSRRLTAERRTSEAASSLGQVNQISWTRNGVVTASRTDSRAARMPAIRAVSVHSDRNAVEAKVIIASLYAMKPLRVEWQPWVGADDNRRSAAAQHHDRCASETGQWSPVRERVGAEVRVRYGTIRSAAVGHELDDVEGDPAVGTVAHLQRAVDRAAVELADGAKRPKRPRDRQSPAAPRQA